MAIYRIHYKHGDLRHMWAGDFKSEEEAMGWWESMKTAKHDGQFPEDWVLKRDNGPEWVTVASHEDGQE